VAAALEGRPDLLPNVGHLVAVMGRRPCRLFHPAEAKGSGILFGHGPVFRDFNFDMDRTAATAVARMRIPTTFVPYDAARNLSLTGPDLAAMERRQCRRMGRRPRPRLARLLGTGCRAGRQAVERLVPRSPCPARRAAGRYACRCPNERPSPLLPTDAPACTVG
jgi:hypothetical protein